MPKIIDCLNSLFVVAVRLLAMSSVVFSLADVESYMARDEALENVLVKHRDLDRGVLARQIGADLVTASMPKVKSVKDI